MLRNLSDTPKQWNEKFICSGTSYTLKTQRREAIREGECSFANADISNE